MNKREVIKRLDALDAEAKELRKIIERGDAMEYDNSLMYVAIFDSHPYILMGYASGEYFRWHSLGLDGYGNPTTQGWADNHKTAQAALDYAARNGKLHAFGDPREAIEFFLATSK